jgi:hypothetical protein
MLSPDAANLGVKAAYIFAGLVLPVFVIVYFFYPEVCRICSLTAVAVY